MIDVKKLITGFLILAVAAVCSGLIFSLVNLSPSVATNAADSITIGGGTAANNTNAFLPTESQVEEVAAALAPGLASSTMTVSSTDPSNLTDDLAAEFVNGVVAANPNGPTGTDTDGNPTFNSPDVNALATNIADSSTTQNIPIPDWDAEAESIPITIIATSSNAALTTYGNAITSIINSHLNKNSQVQSIVSDQAGDTSASDLAFVESQVQSALQDVSSIKVPTPAVAYQKSLLADLVYEKNLIQLNSLTQSDPVKAALVFQQEDEKFYSVQNNFLDQGQNLASKTISLQQPSLKGILLSFLNNTFVIPQANAQIPVTVTTDIPTTAYDLSYQIPLENANETLQLTDHAVAVGGWTGLFSALSAISVQNMGMRLEAILRNTLLQILKNTIIAIIQQKVLTWIQGSGAPKFITNWGTQLVNAAQTSALNSINTLFDKNGCVFPSFVGQEKITLNAFYKSGNNVCANQFAAALGSNSLQQFYNNFANGGFVAFGASTLPSGNPYGDLFFNAQTVAFSYSNQQAASQVKAQTSQGLTGSQVCSDGSNPQGTHVECEGDAGADYAMPAAGICGAGFTPVTEENNDLCANGSQPNVTTPAAATGFVLNSAVDATPKQIAAANDIVGVLNAALNSLLTGLASAAVNAAGKLVNQSLTSLNASSITAAASTTAPAAIPLACNPTSQIVPSITAGNGTSLLSASTTVTASSSVSLNTSPTFLSATGGTLDANNNEPIYHWADSNGATNTGASFSDTFTSAGTYNVYLTDSTGDATSTCTVTVQP